MKSEIILQKARAYIDALTVNSENNIPEKIVKNERLFFSWDNEYRSPLKYEYLFDWSYYNGVVMEGLYDIYMAAPENGRKYYDYVKSYLDAMITSDEAGKVELDKRLAGYVDYHGLDCYKTAALLMKITNGHDVYMELADKLYRVVTDDAYSNSKGNIISKEYMEEALGYNYWHSWARGNAPKYKVWLDGIYMLQPFLTAYAAMKKDTHQLELIKKRFDWVAQNMLTSNGMYYHACNDREDVCKFFWTRAIGWYVMAMVDVMESGGAEFAEYLSTNLKLCIDGMLKYQHTNGMWANLADMPVTETNRLETSGTAMLVYGILKAVRLDWLPADYRIYAIKGFTAITEEKLTENGLEDIYMKAAANNSNNYEDIEYYMADEGKGTGPYIMAYSEMIRI